MPDHDPGSQWSREGLASPQPITSTTGQPSHAWLSAETYASATPQPAAYPALPVAPVEVHVTAPGGGGRGLAVLGVVLGGLALLAMVLVLVFVGLLGLMDDPGGGSGPDPVRGRLAPTKGALEGSTLAEEITKQLNDQGDEPEAITCPQTPKVSQDVTTVCHGMDFGYDTAFVVFFEDDEGSYTLLEV